MVTVIVCTEVGSPLFAQIFVKFPTRVSFLIRRVSYTCHALYVLNSGNLTTIEEHCENAEQRGVNAATGPSAADDPPALARGAVVFLPRPPAPGCSPPYLAARPSRNCARRANRSASVRGHYYRERFVHDRRLAWSRPRPAASDRRLR